MSTTFTTRPNDRWDLIAWDLWQLDLGWAIAEANPMFAGLLVLDGGIEINIPALEDLRRPLVAANPARESAGGFIEVPGGPSPVPSPSPSPGTIQFPITIAQGGTEGTTSQQALANLGAVAIASKGVPGGIAPLDGGAIVPSANLPPYPTLNSLGGVANSSIGVAGGIAPLDSNTRVPIANLPTFQAPITFPISIAQGGTGAATASAGLAALGGIATSQKGVANGIAPLGADSVVPTVNLPTFQSPLTFPLVIAQGGTGGADAATARSNLGAMAVIDRNAANGVAPLVSGLVPISNLPLNSAFPFTNGASFRGGSSPSITPTLVQVSVDSNGLPRYWMVNANAPVNSRIKSITVANNGNVQIRHHNDDLSDGNVLENSASGNTLTNGTFRPGSGSTAFTGATFVPGAIYYRTDLPTSYVNSSGVTYNTSGELTYSDGNIWRRIDGTDTNVFNKQIITGALPASIAANTYTNFGAFVGVGSAFIDSVYLLAVMLMFTDGSNASIGHWQISGAAIISAIQWKAGGIQTPTTFRMEGHNEADFTCSARFAVANVNRTLQLAFDKVLSFSVGSNGYYRCTLKRLL